MVSKKNLVHCPRCNFASASKKGLAIHLATQHKTEKLSANSAPSVPLKSPLTSQGSIFQHNRESKDDATAPHESIQSDDEFTGIQNGKSIPTNEGD